MAKSLILNDLIAALNLKVSVFEKEIKASNGSIVKAIERKSDISDAIIRKILKRFPEVNEKWLETGEGEMLVGEKEESEGDQLRLKKATSDRIQKKIPVLGDAAASTEIELNTTDMSYQEQYIDVGDLLRDSEAAFTVYGNSMTPNYSSGSVLGLKRCYDKFIQPGELYVLETASNRVFKRLYWNDDKTAYVCISDNTMKHESGPREGKYFYEPFEIPIKDVIRLFDVTGMIKRTRNSGIIQRVV